MPWPEAHAPFAVLAGWLLGCLAVGSERGAQGITIMRVRGVPEIRPGDSIGQELGRALRAQGDALRAEDLVVVAQKIVSKAEGRLVRLSDVTPSETATRFALEHNKDPRATEVVFRESRAILRMERGIIISETHHGFVCANAGVDRSNAGAPDTVVLLPTDPDASARRLRQDFMALAGGPVAVIITDTFGRAWREGHQNVAIGLAGLPALVPYAGLFDPDGYELRVTEVALADEIAAAAGLVMGKLERCPIVIVRGLEYDSGSTDTAQAYVRPAERDMFR